MRTLLKDADKETRKKAIALLSDAYDIGWHEAENIFNKPPYRSSLCY